MQLNDDFQSAFSADTIALMGIEPSSGRVPTSIDVKPVS